MAKVIDMKTRQAKKRVRKPTVFVWCLMLEVVCDCDESCGEMHTELITLYDNPTEAGKHAAKINKRWKGTDSRAYTLKRRVRTKVPR